MSLGFLDSLAVLFRLRPKITPDIDGLQAACDVSENAVFGMRICAWVLLIIQLLFILVLPPSWVSNLIAAVVVFTSIVTMHGIVWANNTVRSMVMLARTLQNVVNAQYITIEQQHIALEEQRNTIEEQTRIIRRLSGDAE